MNAPSRFLSEIPADCITEQQTAPPQAKHESRSRAPVPQVAPLPDFRAGMKIEHKAFGAGKILSARAIGNDVLLEAEFDGKGIKRLMAKFAMTYIKITNE
jgi:DNA helicase-2/ATP-dependent DNA helicase PcrA